MRKLAILTVALLAALSAGVLAVTAGSGSSHREAPLSALDPTGDDTDVYAFVAPDAPGSRDPDRQLDPVRGSGRRPELLPLRRPGRRTTSTSTTPATASTTSATGSSSRPRPATPTRSSTRCRA